MIQSFTPCGILDWRAAMAVFRECFPTIPTSEMSYFLRHHGAHVRLFRHGERIGGFSINNPTHGDDRAWLEMIAVGREFRGRGIGQRILEDYERFVGRLGYPRIELAVDANNAPAISLYEKNDYQRLSRAGQRITFAKQIVPATQADSRYRYRPPGLIRRAAHGVLGCLLLRDQKETG